MLPRDDIESAVQIQKRSYKLLRWVGDAIDRGVITFSRAHGDASAADAAFDWISEHYEDLPESARPLPDQLRPFSNYFGSYVTTSFDLVRDPRQRLASSCGCYCELCSHLVDASHLQAKKPSSRDKEKGIADCVSRIELLAKEEELPLSSDLAAALVASHRRESAYSAYGYSLLERLRGSEGGPHVLALWRMIAWKPEGSPIKGFTLESGDIFDAEHDLVAVIARNEEQ
jgi:hypothetical protein